MTGCDETKIVKRGRKTTKRKVRGRQLRPFPDLWFEGTDTLDCKEIRPHVLELRQVLVLLCKQLVDLVVRRIAFPPVVFRLFLSQVELLLLQGYPSYAVAPAARRQRASYTTAYTTAALLQPGSYGFRRNFLCA